MKFKGTKGKSEVSINNPKMVLTDNGAYKPNAMMLSTASAEEMKANAILISDAFNTVNECDMMPSELLARYNEAVEALGNTAKDLQYYYDNSGVEKVIRSPLESSK